MTHRAGQGGFGGSLPALPAPLTTPLLPHSSASTQEHLKRVYGSFAICMFVAAAGAYINVVTHLFQVRGFWGGTPSPAAAG